MIRMVAVDLDDTLLNDEYEISVKTQEAISRTLEKGVKICLVSGRSYSSTKKYIEQLGFRHLSGSLNGACIYDPGTDELIHSLHIDRNVCCSILKVVEACGIHTNYYHGSKVVCSGENQYAWDYMKYTGISMEYVGVLSEYAAAFEAGKLLLMGKREKLEKVRQRLLKDYRQYVDFAFSKPDYLEIYNKAASKGHAVKIIADHYGIPMVEVMAIGDGENDIPMLRSAGLGIAMGNAAAQVKAEADYVTLSNNEHGVAHALWKYVLNDGGKDNEY